MSNADQSKETAPTSVNVQCGLCVCATLIVGDLAGRMQCHRNPPVAMVAPPKIAGGAGQIVALFPVVSKEDWCMQFLPRPDLAALT